MPLIPIEDLDDPRLMVFSNMTDAELRDPHQMVGLALAMERFAESHPNVHRYAFGPFGGPDIKRLEEGLYVAESRNVIERAMHSGDRVFCLLVEECWLEQSRDLIERLTTAFPDFPAFVATREQMQAVTGYQTTRGPLAVFRRPILPRVEAIVEQARRIAVLENVTNYTNIGAIFRSAAALGIDAVLVTPSCHDPLYRRASRVSMGTVFQVPWTRIGEDCGWPEGGIELLRSLGFKTAALALSDDSIPLQSACLKECEKLALVLGTEGDGLAESTIAACDYVVRIPMSHDVDSLNVAAASAVAFWELRTDNRDE